MLIRPAISDDRLRTCLREAYALRADRIDFLPIGNDVNTAAFRVVGDDATPYFLKLRSGPFPVATVTIPAFLHDHGLTQVIPAMRSTQARLWARLEPFAVTLSPFVEGHNGFTAPLSERQWLQLGAALRALHQATLPEALLASLPRERFADEWRERVRALLAALETTVLADAIAAEVAGFLRTHRAEITRLVERAESLGQALRAQPPAAVPCHGDIHAANVLIDPSGALYLVDWDTLIVAPKERDLMFIGGGIGGAWTDEREIDQFYQGYGPTEIDRTALAYYRYERIVEDIAEYGERLMDADLGEADRRAGLAKFVVLFQPGHVVDMARRTEDAGAGKPGCASASR